MAARLRMIDNPIIARLAHLLRAKQDKKKYISFYKTGMLPAASPTNAQTADKASAVCGYARGGAYASRRTFCRENTHHDDGDSSGRKGDLYPLSRSAKLLCSASTSIMPAQRRLIRKALCQKEEFQRGRRIKSFMACV